MSGVDNDGSEIQMAVMPGRGGIWVSWLIYFSVGAHDEATVVVNRLTLLIAVTLVVNASH